MSMVKELAKKGKEMKFNEGQTKELLKNLESKGIEVGVENFAQYVKQQGVIVKVHVGGGRKEFNISSSIYGINESNLGEETKEFMQKHMKKGKVTFLPDHYEKELKKIDARLRKKKRELAIGYEDSFMTIGIFNEFKEYFEECVMEYMATRDKIVAEYEQLVARFKQITETSLKELNALDREKEYQRIMSSIPKKEYYKDSFYINLSVRAFPVMENMDVFEEGIRNEIVDGLTEDTMNILYEGIGRTLSDAFVALSNVLAGCDKGTVHHKTIEGVKNSIRRIGLKNIFHNEKIEEVKRDMQELLQQKNDADILAEVTELILAKIYCYARELKIVHYIDTSKCLLTPSELMDIYEEVEEVEAI